MLRNGSMGTVAYHRWDSTLNAKARAEKDFVHWLTVFFQWKSGLLIREFLAKIYERGTPFQFTLERENAVGWKRKSSIWTMRCNCSFLYCNCTNDLLSFSTNHEMRVTFMIFWTTSTEKNTYNWCLGWCFFSSCQTCKPMDDVVISVLLGFV